MSSATKKTIAKKVESVKKTFKDCAYLIDIAVMHGQAQGKDYNKIKKINIRNIFSAGSEPVVFFILKRFSAKINFTI